MEMLDDFLNRTIKTEKLFSFDGGTCFYTNVESVSKKIKNDEDSQIKISNNVCKEAGNNLLKITEVRFGNKVIYVEDSYRFIGINFPETNVNNSLQPTNSSDSCNNNNDKSKDSQSQQHVEPTRKKKMIFKRSNLDSITQTSKRRNTKNIAKNFCKAFLSYLEDKRAKEVLTETKKLVLLHNYNNKSIEKLAVNQLTKKEFKEFLTNKAEEWITSSKIHDKDIHTSAIELYLQLIDRESSEVIHEDENSENEDQSLFYSDQGSDDLEKEIYFFNSKE